jgi:protein gp37
MRQFQKNPKIRAQYQGLTYLRDGIPTFNGTVRIHPERLALPNRTKKPTVWAVWDDLFHPSIPSAFLSEVLDQVFFYKKHTFLILTKRADYMMKALSDWTHMLPLGFKSYCVWCGFTACNQNELERNIKYIWKIQAAQHWVSLEPLLEYVSIKSAVYAYGRLAKDIGWGIDGVIVGPETGPHRRPCKIEWIRTVKDECVAAGVPLFIKALDLNGKISTDMAEWPSDLRVRQLPWRQP